LAPAAIHPSRYNGYPGKSCGCGSVDRSPSMARLGDGPQAQDCPPHGALVLPGSVSAEGLVSRVEEALCYPTDKLEGVDVDIAKNFILSTKSYPRGGQLDTASSSVGQERGEGAIRCCVHHTRPGNPILVDSKPTPMLFSRIRLSACILVSSCC
jgi:hypothetical protein